MTFQCDEIIKTDAGGRITGLGVEWSEGRPGREGLAANLAMLGMAGGIGLLIIAAGKESAGAATAAVASLAFAVGMALLTREYDGRRRTVLLGLDGSISAPQGLCGYTNIRGALRYRIDDIRSIEVARLKDRKADQPDRLLHGVKVVMRRGNVIYFAWNLDEDDALMVATYLNDAVDTMRSLASSLATTEKAPARNVMPAAWAGPVNGHGAPRAPTRFID